MSEALIRLKRVQEKTGKKRSAIYDSVRAGTFPKPVEIGPRQVAWVESEVDAWISARITSSRSKSPPEALHSRRLAENDLGPG